MAGVKGSILGPATCQGCGLPVWYVVDSLGRRWLHEGRRARCLVESSRCRCEEVTVSHADPSAPPMAMWRPRAVRPSLPTTVRVA